MAYQIHPAILDAGLTGSRGCGCGGSDRKRSDKALYLPTHIDQFRVHDRPGRHLWSHARVQHRDVDATTGEVQLLDETGRVAIEILGLRFDFLDEGKQSAVVDSLDDWLYEFQWQPKERRGRKSLPRQLAAASWLIFTDSGGVGDALSALLEAGGERSILVAHGESYAQTDSEHYSHPSRTTGRYPPALRVRLWYPISVWLSRNCPSLES